VDLIKNTRGEKKRGGGQKGWVVGGAGRGKAAMKEIIKIQNKKHGIEMRSNSKQQGGTREV